MDLPSPKRKCTEINAVEVAVSNAQAVYEQNVIIAKTLDTINERFDDFQSLLEKM
jgi:hypothetical protein